MKKYLYMTPFFPSPQSWRGGFCLDAVKAIRRTHQYDVVVMKIEEGDDYEVEGIKVYRIMRKSVGFGDYFPCLYRRYNEGVFLRRLAELFINVDDIAICHVHDLTQYSQYACIVKRLNPNCITLLHHHFACDCWTPFLGRFGYVPVLSELRYLYYRCLYLKFDVNVFVSQKQKECFGKYKIGCDMWNLRYIRELLPTQKMLPQLVCRDAIVVYNGVDDEVFYPAPHRHDGFVIGCVANYFKLKRHIDLIKSLPYVVKAIPNVKLRLVGSGDELQTCKNYVIEHGLAHIVSFEREVGHAQLSDFYNSLDLFVLPSVSEAFGCVLTEAQACGVPIVCCRGLSSAEVMDEESKRTFLYEPYDSEDLARVIINVYRNRPTVRLNVDMSIHYQIGNLLSFLKERVVNF